MLSRCFHFGVFEIFVSSLFLLVISAFELGGYGGKVTIYLRNDKGKKKKNKRMVIIALKEAAQTTIMIFFLRICFEIVKY